MTLTIAQTYRQSELNNYATQFGPTAQIAVHVGSAPTDADTAMSGASNGIIVALPYTATTPFGTASAAKPSVITAATITTTNVYGTGTATFFRSYACSTPGIATGNFVVNNAYMIQAIGSSTAGSWATVGLNSTITTAANGQMFVATATTLAGTGTAYLMNTVEQGTVGAGSGDLNLNTTSLVAGGPLQITSLTRSM